jgi:glycosyltransferase involved in cell wall biosynthesis
MEFNQPGNQIEVSVIICTRDRLALLNQTLACLAVDGEEANLFEVIVVFNSDGSEIPRFLAHANYRFPIRALHESRTGKGYALNRGIHAEPKGEVIAVLDDDMSPEPGWIRGIISICKKWPSRAFFTGSSYVIWPEAVIPSYCRHPNLKGWAFSVMSVDREKTLGEGRWFSGNHYWFRRTVISGPNPFSTIETHPEAQMYATEPQFMLNLREAGHRGITTPEVRCGHRIQPSLLSYLTLTRRARLVGIGFAIARMLPPKSTSKQSRLFKAYPILAQWFCVTGIIGWSAVKLCSYLLPCYSSAIVWRLHAIQRYHTYKTYLEIAKTNQFYNDQR